MTTTTVIHGTGRVNEKTLEPNVGAEMLGVVRQTHPRAYIRALTQAEENGIGLDYFLRLPKGTVSYLFQFKAPMSTSKPPLFRFRLEREQHMRLQLLMSLYPETVFYVLPHF